jgi:hypothetical protein
MNNLTQSEREGLNELFSQLDFGKIPFYKRLLIKVSQLFMLFKLYLLR